MRRVIIGLLMFSLGIQGQLHAQITNFPYIQDFESGYAGWTVQGVLPSWELGPPNNILINSAVSGTNAIVTNLTGTYNNQENSWVESPPFDLSGLTNPYVKLDVFWDIETDWDGAVLQSSIDNGSTWQNVGAYLDGSVNWYNSNTIFANPGGQVEGWTNFNNGSQGWKAAIHDIFNLAGESNVIFRIAFASDSINIPEGYEGFAFDNFSILEDPCYAGEDNSITLCTSESIVSLIQYLIDADAGGTWSTEGPLAITANGDIDIQETAFIPETSFEFIYTVTSENGACTDTALIFVDLQETFPLDSATLDVCASLASEQDLLDAVGDPNGDANGSWFDSNGELIDFNQTPEVGAGIYEYFVSATGFCPPQSETVEVIVDEPEPWAGGFYDDFAGRASDLTQRSFPIFGNLFELLAEVENLQAPTEEDGGDWADSEYGCDDDSFDCETGDYDFRSLGPGNYQVSFTYKVESGSCGPSEFVVNLDVDVPFYGTDGTLQWCAGDTPFTESDLLNALNGNVNDTQGFWTPDASDPSFGEAGDYIYEAGNTDTATVTVEFTSCPSEIASKIWLQGAYDGGLMRDDLRNNGLVSLQSPYIDGASIDSAVLNDGGTTQTGAPADNIV
ncbi:MAG: hypothetical protein HKP45_08980, partial [Winogradskyella sp.]|nr:hypothetical protein [Winogradskyella sp.]